MYHRIGAAFDTHCRGLLVDNATQGFNGCRFTQCEIEWMDMPAAHVEHAALIQVTGDDFANATLIQQFQLGVAVALPQALLRLQMAHLLAGDGSEHSAILQVALDLILGDPLTNDPAAFEGHLAKQLSLLGADTAFNHINVAAIAVDDLPTVTPGSAESNPGRFQDGDFKTVLKQEQGAGEAGVAGTDHADIGFHIILQQRAGWSSVG